MRPKRDNKSMTTRAFIGTMAAGAMAVFLAPLVAAQHAGAKPLNVVFIVTGRVVATERRGPWGLVSDVGNIVRLDHTAAAPLRAGL